METVIKGHWLACACDVLGINSLEEHILLPTHSTDMEKRLYIESIAKKVVDRFGVVDSAFFDDGTDDTEDRRYNYARVLCHYGSLILEIQDAWREGDGERMIRCWKLALPHFQAFNHTKYSIQALRLQFQTSVVLSPNLAHQVKWHRFVNTRGGQGRNIPCDLHNEHMNKLIKEIIGHMGSNLTEEAVQRAVRSMFSLDVLCKKFDAESGVPHITSAHSTRSNTIDVKKVVGVLLEQKLLKPIGRRQHRAFANISLNPLHRWDSQKTMKWIDEKKKQYLRNSNKFKPQKRKMVF